MATLSRFFFSDLETQPACAGLGLGGARVTETVIVPAASAAAGGPGFQSRPKRLCHGDGPGWGLESDDSDPGGTYQVEGPAAAGGGARGRTGPADSGRPCAAAPAGRGRGRSGSVGGTVTVAVI